MSRKVQKLLYGFLLVLFAAVFVYSAYRLIAYYSAKHESDRVVAEAQRYVSRPEGTGLDKEEEKERLVVDFDQLKAINEDVVGWLYCAGTHINYPVVQAADNEYYLYRLVDRTWNENGSLFLDYRSPDDFSGINNIIYGHHMRSGAMLADLTKYKTQSFYDEHPSMYLATPQQHYRLDLFAGCVVSGADSIYMGNVTQDILQRCFNYSTFRSQFDEVPEGRVLTLSTCSYEYEEARYVVMGVLVPLEED